MGAWDVGPFENDAALDVLGDIKETSFSEWLEDVSEEFALDKYIDSDVGSAIIAVSAIIVGFRPSVDEGKEKCGWDVFASKATSKEVRKLKRLLKTVLKNKNKSELYELWDETDALKEWQRIGFNILRQL